MRRHTHKQRGISLVEVMVALALGLIVSVGALSLMLGNRQSYRTTEALARVQEATRITFDLMSRDLRAAGINACSGGVRVMNLLADPAAPTRWWTSWNGGLRGFDNTGAAGAVDFGSETERRVANTDMIELMHASVRSCRCLLPCAPSPNQSPLRRLRRCCRTHANRRSSSSTSGSALPDRRADSSPARRRCRR